MKENSENPLNLEDKLYTVEEFASIIKEKFGNNNNVSDIFLTEMFLVKLKNLNNTFHREIVVAVNIHFFA